MESSAVLQNTWMISVLIEILHLSSSKGGRKFASQEAGKAKQEEWELMSFPTFPKNNNLQDKRAKFLPKIKPEKLTQQQIQFEIRILIL